MNLINSSRRQPGFTAVVFALLCTVLVGTAAWRTLADRPGKAEAQLKIAAANAKRGFKERLGRGVGNIRLATEHDSSDKVRASVDATAEFIFERSDLKMSDATKQRLARVEEDTLNGGTSRISLDNLTDTLTDVVVERAGTLSDKEIREAADAYQTIGTGELITRSGGKWGAVSKDEFQQQMRSARDWARRGDGTLRQAIRPLMAEEVETRANDLSEALPDQFGRIKDVGVTPVQAALIGYSVATDDPLDGSADDTKEQLVQQRIMTRQERGDQRDSHKPYGIKGALFASPAHLLLNKETSKRLLDRYEGGRK